MTLPGSGLIHGDVRAAVNALITRLITTSGGITGGGDLSANRTLTVDQEWLADYLGTFITQADNGNITITYDDAAVGGSGRLIAAVPAATALVKGAVELATDAEAITGTDTSRAITPANLKAYIDSVSAGLVTVLADTNQIVNNSATLVDDAKLVYALEANAFYMVDVFLVYNLAAGGGTTTDLKVVWTVPTGTTGYWASNTSWSQPGAASASNGLLVGLTTNRDFALQEGTQGVSARLLVYSGATAGNLQMRWAQNTAAAFDLTRYAGSNMLVRKLS